MGWIGLDGWIHESVEDEGIMPKYSFSLLEGSSELIRKVSSLRSVGCRGRLDPVREQFKKWDKDGKGDHESLHDAERWMVKTLYVLLGTCWMKSETQR